MLRSLLVSSVLVALAGCGPTFDTEVDDAVACAGVRCTAGTCFSNAGQPMCRCGPWEDSAGLVCQVAAFVTPDDHGGSPAEATPLPLMEGPRQGRISASSRGQSDRDLFSFTAKEGHTYFFFCEPGSLPRCLPRLLDGSGRQVSSVPLDSRRTFWILNSLEPGTWYVEVSGDGGATGTYTYQLFDMGLDDFGDGPAQAAGREPSDVPFKVTSTFLGDIDVLRLQAEAGHAYRFGCVLPSLESGVALRLLDAAGRPVDSTDGLGARNQPWLDLKAAASGPWFMEVRPTYGQPPLTFDCKLTDLGLDDHGDTAQSATRVTPGVPVSVRMHSSKDVDAFVFTGEPARYYALTQQPRVPVSIQLFDGAGRRLGVIPPNASLPMLPGAPGEYHFEVIPLGAAPADAPFQLTLVDLGPDDHPTYVSEAVPSPLEVPISVSAQFDSDFDTLLFDGDADGVYAVTCEPECTMSLGVSGLPGGGYPTHVTSRRVALNDATSLSLTVVSSSFLESHTVTVRRVGTDDFPAMESLATTHALPVSGSLDAENDVDVFTVELEAGRSYTVRTPPSSLMTFRAVTEGWPLTPSGGRLIAPWTGTYVVTFRLEPGGFPGEWSLSPTSP